MTLSTVYVLGTVPLRFGLKYSFVHTICFRKSPLQFLIFAKLGNMTDSCMLNLCPDTLKQFCAFFALKLLKCWGHTLSNTLPEILFWNILLEQFIHRILDLETSLFNAEQVWITPVVYIHVLTCIFVQYFLVHNVCFVITVTNSPKWDCTLIWNWIQGWKRNEKNADPRHWYFKHETISLTRYTSSTWHR